MRWLICLLVLFPLMVNAQEEMQVLGKCRDDVEAFMRNRAFCGYRCESFGDRYECQRGEDLFEWRMRDDTCVIVSGMYEYVSLLSTLSGSGYDVISTKPGYMIMGMGSVRCIITDPVYNRGLFRVSMSCYEGELSNSED